LSSTKPLKEALNGKPAPQYFNPDVQEYEYLLGKYGASRQILYGPDGNPISTSSGKLAVRATEIESLLNDIKGKDYATQTTLAAILAQLGTTASAAVTDPTASAAVIQLLKGLLKQLQGAGTGAASVQLTGSIETVVDNPATGIKTITTTAAELFAGAYAKTNRRKLIIKNEDQSLRFRIGKADITQQNGFPVEPGAVVIIPFDPAVIVPIYAISEGASLQASVMEV
jgi:hypothetical protein